MVNKLVAVVCRVPVVSGYARRLIFWIGVNTQMIFRSLIACLMLLIFQVAWAQSSSGHDDHIVTREYYADPQGLLGIDEISNKSFASAGEVLARGYTPDTHWIRLHIRAAAGGALWCCASFRLISMN